ncbi:MAG: hypothetical protein FWB76_07035 [Oscillospiraceae bacterium]|nr:hypothetical protein [Oscillospiraceae bacterium]
MTNITKISIAVLAVLVLIVGGWLGIRHLTRDNDPPAPYTTVANQQVNIPVTRAGLTAMGHSVTQTSHMVDSIGRESTRDFTGVPVPVILAAHGVDVANAAASATVLVTAHDGVSFTLNRAQFSANTTLLAYVEDRGAGDVRQLTRPRLVFPQGLSGTFVQQVVSITFNP